MTINFNPDGKKTILSIEGGGVRGIIPLLALQKLERDTGQPCHELFDLISGTSVGALIAAGIAAGRTIDELIDAYDEFVRAIFKLDVLAIIFRHGLRYLYDKADLRQVLRDMLGEVTLAELDPAILLTVKDMGRSETIFFVNRGPGAQATQHAKLWQVAEASASAPLYFQPVGDGVDGGVGTYGNTTYVVTVEAMQYLAQTDPDWQPGNVIHLSFGTGQRVFTNARRGGGALVAVAVGAVGGG
jgi:patatin-like phospholipase/acyl hydrolase